MVCQSFLPFFLLSFLQLITLTITSLLILFACLLIAGEVSKVTYYPGQALPTVVHYCQSFRAGEFGFFKRRVPKDIFSCESDLLLEPPTTLAHSDYIIKKNEVAFDL